MNNDEFKESMEELYKFLREKIITMYGEYLSEETKKRLYAFDTERDILIDNSSRKPVEYDFEEKKFIISDGFINSEYIEKIKSKNSFDLIDIKEKINNNNYNVLTEELIVFSSELNIKEKDIIKSLFVQEILKMILMTEDLSIKENIILEGSIELLAHQLGFSQGFIVSTSKSAVDVLEIAVKLKEILEESFESEIFSKNIEKIINELVDIKLLEKISKITYEKTVLESTQNLDEVVDSINEVVEEVNQVVVIDIDGKQVIKFIDENGTENLYDVENIDAFLKVYNKLKMGSKIIKKSELLNYLELNNIKVIPHSNSVELSHIVEDSTYESKKIEVNKEDGLYVKEAIVKIDQDEQGKEEFNELNEKFKEDSNSLTQEELNKMSEYISDNDIKNIKIGKSGKRKILTIVLVIVATIIVGIFLGWLLFKLR